MNTEPYDITLDESEDLSIINGDFLVAPSTVAHQRQLVLCSKGDFKEDPTKCVGAATYFDDENFQGLVRAIATEFTRDGMDVAEVRLDNGVIKSSATYPTN